MNVGKYMKMWLFFMIFQVAAIFLSSSPCRAVPDGDLNGDLRVTVADALLVLRIAVGLNEATPQALDHGDVFPLENGVPAPDGAIRVNDALLVLRKAVGLVSWDLVPGPVSIVSVVPPAGSLDVGAATTITVTFSEPVDPASLSADTFAVTDGNGIRVSGAFDVTGPVVTFTPTENLAFLASHQVTVTTGVVDQGGNPLTEGLAWTFTTRDWPQLSLPVFVSGFVQPAAIAHAGDGSGRMFVVEQGGFIRIVRNGITLPAPFLDVSAVVTPTGGEQGLLGIAFPPGFATKRYFYIHYTNRQGIGDTVVARYHLTADGDLADAASGETILTATQPFGNHNGGQLAFGPDGLLRIALGDGGSGGDPLGNAQNTNTLLGKILRIDTESGAVPYGIPADNPVVGNRVGEIWAFGLRNPWRFSFDRRTGDLFIGDVGQEQFEEIDFQPASSGGGENYGWNIMEGAHCFADPACNQAGLVLPVQEYQHLGGNCSVTGGYVYRGNEFPELRGVYLYGDFCSGMIWGLRQINGEWQNRLLLDTVLLISTFGEDEAGELYVADYGTGEIRRIVAQ